MFALIHSYLVQFNTTRIPIDVTTPTEGSGVFEVQYNWTLAGVYWMSITINETEIGTSPPGIVVVSPNAVYPPKCTADGEATSVAIVKV